MRRGLRPPRIPCEWPGCTVKRANYADIPNDTEDCPKDCSRPHTGKKLCRKHSEVALRKTHPEFFGR